MIPKAEGGKREEEREERWRKGKKELRVKGKKKLGIKECI